MGGATVEVWREAASQSHNRWSTQARVKADEALLTVVSLYGDSVAASRVVLLQSKFVADVVIVLFLFRCFVVCVRRALVSVVTPAAHVK